MSRLEMERNALFRAMLLVGDNEGWLTARLQVVIGLVRVGTLVAWLRCR